ncbi:CII family transcriptional regulator [Pantoea trifolii]|uniref:CII family transcriptional regulator n=1 Tax=Candidatus Pantoea symbiotica TaxID=1884370 RepID=UPI00241346E2|nr:CII family transcriptional regulator [Pantoea rodasii]
MERAQKRTEARKIESALLNKIAMKGSQEIAELIGIDRSQVTRWKRDWIPKLSMLLAVLEWGVVDDDMARLAREVAALLRKKKSPAATEDSQYRMDF